MTINTVLQPQQVLQLHDPEARELLRSGQKILQEFEELYHHQQHHQYPLIGDVSTTKTNYDTDSTSTNGSSTIPNDQVQITSKQLQLHDQEQAQQQQQQPQQIQGKPTPYIYPVFDASEIRLGPVLGHGGFGIVYEVQDIVLNESSSSNHNNHAPTNVIIHEDDDDPDESTFHNNNISNDNQHPDHHYHHHHHSIQKIMEQEPISVAENDHYYYESYMARYYMAANVRRTCQPSDTTGDISTTTTATGTSDTTTTTTSTTAARYAMKRLKSDLNELSHVRGAIDLAIEVKILSKLHHPNIVKMRGYSNQPLLDLNFFIIMDRLYEILNHRIMEWKQSLLFTTPTGNHSISATTINKQQSCPALKKDASKLNHHRPNILQTIKSRFSRQMKEERERIIQDILMQRLIVAYDLAAAFAYMHENNVVYRDIKQENIGFDVRGDVKVFDFGLSKCTSSSLRARDKVTGEIQYGYNLTPLTGSIPYMAPEVACGRPYDGQCDVYSFSILIWEIFTLKKAFRFIDRHDYMDSVVKNGERPSFPILGNATTAISSEIKDLIKESWKSNPQQRPTMANVTKRLRHELNDVCDGDDTVLRRSIHMNNRSNHSFRVEIQRQRSSTNLLVRRTSSSTNFNLDSIHYPNGASPLHQQKPRSNKNLLRRASSKLLQRETSTNELDGKASNPTTVSFSKSTSFTLKDLRIQNNTTLDQQTISYRNGIES